MIDDNSNQNFSYPHEIKLDKRPTDSRRLLIKEEDIKTGNARYKNVGNFQSSHSKSEIQRNTDTSDLTKMGQMLPGDRNRLRERGNHNVMTGACQETGKDGFCEGGVDFERISNDYDVGRSDSAHIIPMSSRNVSDLCCENLGQVTSFVVTVKEEVVSDEEYKEDERTMAADRLSVSQDCGETGTRSFKQADNFAVKEEGDLICQNEDLDISGKREDESAADFKDAKGGELCADFCCQYDLHEEDYADVLKIQSKLKNRGDFVYGAGMSVLGGTSYRVVDENDRIESDDYESFEAFEVSAIESDDKSLSGSAPHRLASDGNSNEHSSRQDSDAKELSPCSESSKVQVDGRCDTDEWITSGFKCRTCSARFSTSSEFTNHICSAFNISCDHCGKRFRDLDGLQRHEKVHFGTKPFKCDICDKSFREKSKLTIHWRTHSKETPYQCPTCGKRFGDPSNLNRHKKSHLSVEIAKPCRCKVCGERFSRTGSLLRHLVRFHKGVKEVLQDDLNIGNEADIQHKFKKYACQYCGKKFGRKESVNSHELLHNESDALICKFCNEVKNCKDGLLLHLKIHGAEGERNAEGERSAEGGFVCRYCGAAFMRKSSLLGHERNHSDERPYACTKCDARFTLKTRLTRHMQIHSGVKPHGCDVCSKRFLRFHDLTVHKRIHSDERPFVCDKCGHGFNAQTNLTKHKKVCGDALKASRKLRTSKLS